MKREKVLVVLRGFGEDYYTNKKFYENLAKHFKAQLHFITAPHKCDRERGGEQWFPITPTPERKFIFNDGQFEKSLKHIHTELNHIRSSKNCDVILAGRSQGALMAIYSASWRGEDCKCVIALCPYLSYDLPKILSQPYCTPVIWVEAGKDDLLPNHLKESHRFVNTPFHNNFKFLKNPKSTHDTLSNSIIPQLKELERRQKEVEKKQRQQIKNQVKKLTKGVKHKIKTSPV